MKRIPYGISNFQALREEEYLYVDKTSYFFKYTLNYLKYTIDELSLSML